MGIFDLFKKKTSIQKIPSENENLKETGNILNMDVEKTNESNVFDTDDVRNLVVQLSENNPKIVLNVEDRYFGVFQLEQDLKEEEFERVDPGEFEYFDTEKPAYAGTTIYREYECFVSKQVLIQFLNEYIESSEFDEDEMDLDSFLNWAHFEHGHSFEQDLDSGEIKEIVEVQGKKIYKVENWEVEEQSSCDLSIKFNE